MHVTENNNKRKQLKQFLVLPPSLSADPACGACMIDSIVSYTIHENGNIAANIWLSHPVPRTSASCRSFLPEGIYVTKDKIKQIAFAFAKPHRTTDCFDDRLLFRRQISTHFAGKGKVKIFVC